LDVFFVRNLENYVDNPANVARNNVNGEDNVVGVVGVIENIENSHVRVADRLAFFIFTEADNEYMDVNLVRESRMICPWNYCTTTPSACRKALGIWTIFHASLPPRSARRAITAGVSV
jgi:hypothetical protein